MIQCFLQEKPMCSLLFLFSCAICFISGWKSKTYCLLLRTARKYTYCINRFYQFLLFISIDWIWILCTCFSSSYTIHLHTHTHSPFTTNDKRNFTINFHITNRKERRRRNIRMVWLLLEEVKKLNGGKRCSLFLFSIFFSRHRFNKWNKTKKKQTETFLHSKLIVLQCDVF